MVVARTAASILASTTVGLLWSWKGDDALLSLARAHDHADSNRFDTFVATLQHDFVHAGGFLIVGAATAATLQTFAPRSAFDSVGGNAVTGVVFLALLAVTLSICSEGDAFVAAGLSQFSLTARLAFLVVGPMVDLKLIALQVGTFGRSFALRFAPLVFCTAVLSSVVVANCVLR